MSDKYEQLERLGRLKESGTLSKEEFDKQKKEILNHNYLNDVNNTSTNQLAKYVLNGLKIFGVICLIIIIFYVVLISFGLFTLFGGLG